MAADAGPRVALLTGATGFIGSRLARQLLADGWSVHAVTRAGSKIEQLAPIATNVRLHEHDGTTEGLSAIVSTVRPTVVFHLASLFLLQHKPAEVEPLMRSNVVFGAQLLEAMTAAGEHRLVNTGTFWQHYENNDYSPVCLYAATKQAFEAIVQFYVETTPLRVLTLKLNDTYGPGDPRPKLLALLQRAAESGRPLAMSPGEQLIDMVYIEDTVQAFILAADRLLGVSGAGHETFAVSSGAPLKLKELVALYQKTTGRPLPIEFGGRPYRPREVMTPWNRGRPLPGWRPKVDLAEGIRRCTVEDAPQR